MARANIRQSTTDRIFSMITYGILGLLTLAVVYPLVFVISASFSSPAKLITGDVFLWPVQPTLNSYRAVLRESRLWLGYKNTFIYTGLGTVVSMILTVIAAYPLSRRDLVGRNAIMMLLTVTMFFSGGLIPMYLVVRTLGLLNTVWAVVLPGAVSVTNIIIARTFFSESIPYELQESAFIDGCTNLRIVSSIILPLSAPILAVLVMFYGVGYWNAYFNAMMYLTNSKMFPLQIALREILIVNSIADATDTTINTVDQILLYEGLKYAVVIVASFPVMCLYPFLQRYFIKGVMIGAIKG